MLFVVKKLFGRPLYISIVLCFLAPVFCGRLLGGDTGWILLFGSRDCDECQSVKEQWQQEFLPGEDPVLVFLEIEKNANYQLLSKIETILQITEKSDSFPVFLVGNRLLPDVDSFYELEEEELFRLAAKPLDIPALSALRQAVQNTDQAVISWEAPVTGMSMASAETGVRTAYLLYFLQKNCAKCSRQQKELELLQEQLPGLELTRCDIATMQGQVILSRARRAFQIPEDFQNPAPMLCWAEGYINGRLASAEELKTALLASKANPFWLAPVTEDELHAEQKHQEHTLKAFSLGMIILAGLGDGFNPCAFATSVFLIGYLLYLKRRRREIALVGAGFCIGVFATYLLFGLGLSFLIDFLNRMLWLKIAIYGVFGVAGLLLCIGHLRDAFRFRKTGKASTFSLGLSVEMHRRIHDQIRSLTEKRSWLMFPAAIMLGGIVSSLELACTGQVYLPTLAAINAHGLNTRALMLLLLYNLFFILPLVLLTVLAICGVEAKGMAGWARKHVFISKIALAVFFAAISLLMFWFILSSLPVHG